jgi:hypothetical protein
MKTHLNDIAKVAGFFALALVSLWVGSYVLGTLHSSDWRLFPAWVTMISVIVASVIFGCVQIAKTR